MVFGLIVNTLSTRNHVTNHVIWPEKWAKAHYSNGPLAGVASTMTNWMFEDSTDPVVPLYVPKVYPTVTIRDCRG
jgi:hypothetical protein